MYALFMRIPLLCLHSHTLAIHVHYGSCPTHVAHHYHAQLVPQAMSVKTGAEGDKWASSPHADRATAETGARRLGEVERR